jgi:hypothetical protein
LVAAIQSLLIPSIGRIGNDRTFDEHAPSHVRQLLEPFLRVPVDSLFRNERPMPRSRPDIKFDFLRGYLGCCASAGRVPLLPAWALSVRRGPVPRLSEVLPRPGASRQVPRRIDCLARRRVRMPVAGFVLRVKPARSGFPLHAQVLAWESPPATTVTQGEPDRMGGNPSSGLPSGWMQAGSFISQGHDGIDSLPRDTSSFLVHAGGGPGG